MSITKSDASPTLKKGGVTGQSETKNMLALRVRAKLVPYVGNISERLGDYGRPIPPWWTVSSHEIYVNLLPSGKKASLFKASLSVLIVMFHYIQLIHH